MARSKKHLSKEMRASVMEHHRMGMPAKRIIQVTGYSKAFVYTTLRKAGTTPLKVETPITLRCPKCGRRLAQENCIACELSAAPVSSSPPEKCDPRRLTRSELDDLLSRLYKTGNLSLAQAIKANYEKNPPTT